MKTPSIPNFAFPPPGDKVKITIKNVTHYRIPTQRILREAANLALTRQPQPGILPCVELGIRVVGQAESALLNQQYRHKNYPTNVLAFAVDVPQLGLLGDLVICAEVVKQEALDFRRTLSAHFSHMVIHGTLHLLGFDHQTESEAVQMESLESQFMQQLGFADPYETSKKIYDRI